MSAPDTGFSTFDDGFDFSSMDFADVAGSDPSLDTSFGSDASVADFSGDIGTGLQDESALAGWTDSAPAWDPSQTDYGIDAYSGGGGVADSAADTTQGSGFSLDTFSNITSAVSKFGSALSGFFGLGSPSSRGTAAIQTSTPTSQRVSQSTGVQAASVGPQTIMTIAIVGILLYAILAKES